MRGQARQLVGNIGQSQPHRTRVIGDRERRQNSRRSWSGAAICHITGLPAAAPTTTQTRSAAQKSQGSAAPSDPARVSQKVK